MADSVTVNKILNEYEELRTKADNERRLRIDMVYEKVPRIKEIDDKIYSLGFSNMQNILKNPDEADRYNSEMKEKFKILRAEKQRLIEENNIPSNYDEYEYECKECKDTGFTENGKKCGCFTQRLINEAYAKSNLGDTLKKQNFDMFSFDYYSKKSENGKISPYENIVRIYNYCKKFCGEFDTIEKSLFFYGPTGLGKTFVSSCIAKDIMDKGKTVIYTRSTKLFNIYDDYKFGRNSDKSVIDNLYDADLLIIDDLGTEPQSKNNLSFLFDLIYDRLSEGKKIIINTNLSMKEIEKTYSSRFSSRIYESFMIYGFYGEDIRIQKMKNGG